MITFLKVADKWQFEAQKQAALELLKRSGTPAEKITVGRLFPEAKELIVPAFMELASRYADDPPTESEVSPLGAPDLLRVWHASKFLKKHVSYGYSLGQVSNGIAPMLLNEMAPIESKGSIF